MSAVRPILKRLHSPDVTDLETFAPVDPHCFSFLMQAMFGPEGGRGEESFDIVVCTPAWIAREVEHKGMIDGRHHLVVREFSFPIIKSFLDEYARRSSGNTWQEVAAKLARLGKWEFEDYSP